MAQTLGLAAVHLDVAEINDRPRLVKRAITEQNGPITT
jgi:hypothetical protein